MQLAFDNITTDPVPIFSNERITVSILRLDKIHPVISGNKWFKLQYYLQEAKEQDKKKIITFGGPWSNHIVATAAACQMNEIASIGIIRGEATSPLSATLVQAKNYGMQLEFVSRDAYREKKIPAVFQKDNHYLVAEGGYGKKGAEGAATILEYAAKEFTHCCCAVGTGTMMAGLLNAVSPIQKVTGISVLKNNFDLEKNVGSLLTASRDFQVIHDYHFGGYAKHKPELMRFMNEFYQQTLIPSDFVYTGKLFYAIADLIKNNFFPEGSQLLLIHSGGLQGNASLKKGTLIF
jgi:1-aminocyclopropane-1-carboxylate deaminase